MKPWSQGAQLAFDERIPRQLAKIPRALTLGLLIETKIRSASFLDRNARLVVSDRGLSFKDNCDGSVVEQHTDCISLFAVPLHRNLPVPTHKKVAGCDVM